MTRPLTRVGYFGRPIGLTGGIARYTSQLLLAMMKTAPHLEYLVYTNRLEQNSDLNKCAVRQGPGWLGRVGWEQLVLGRQIARDRPDVYHGTDFTLPYSKPVNYVATIHDLIFKRHPEGTSWKARVLYNTLTSRSVKMADRIVAVSEYTRRDIADTFKVTDDKIRVISHGVDSNLTQLLQPGEADTIICELGIRRPYVLFVGLLTPRKGVLTLIEAYNIVRQESGLRNLVLTGLEGSGYDRIQSAIDSSPFRDSIVLTGGAGDRKLAALYDRASVFCLPSVHEGFGLPILEAMSFGCPVIAADATSLPEVVGDAGLLFPPGNVNELAILLNKVMQDSSLAGKLSEAGKIWAGMHTWEDTAKKTLAVYSEALNS